MDPRDLFRGIFGFDRRRFDGSERTRDDRCLDDDEYEDGNDLDGMADMFRHFHEDMQRQMGHLSQEMEEIFRHSGSTDFSLGVPEQPSLPSPDNPRDSMLKPPGRNDPADASPRQPPGYRGRDIPSLFGGLFLIPGFYGRRPQFREDRDLDSDVVEKGLPALGKPDCPEACPDGHLSVPETPGFFSSSRSVSITTIRGADGKMEQRKTVRDSKGNEETTVTRQVGDKSYTVKTKKDKFGVLEENETFQNIDEGDKDSFNNGWQSKGRQPHDHPEAIIVPKVDPKDSSIFKKLFGFDFSGLNK